MVFYAFSSDYNYLFHPTCHIHILTPQSSSSSITSSGKLFPESFFQKPLSGKLTSLPTVPQEPLS